MKYLETAGMWAFIPFLLGLGLLAVGSINASDWYRANLRHHWIKVRTRRRESAQYIVYVGVHRG